MLMSTSSVFTWRVLWILDLTLCLVSTVFSFSSFHLGAVVLPITVPSLQDLLYWKIKLAHGFFGADSFLLKKLISPLGPSSYWLLAIAGYHPHCWCFQNVCYGSVRHSQLGALPILRSSHILSAISDFHKFSRRRRLHYRFLVSAAVVLSTIWGVIGQSLSYRTGRPDGDVGPVGNLTVIHPWTLAFSSHGPGFFSRRAFV